METEQGAWVVPPQRAVWVPAGMSHAVTMTGWVEMRTLYLARAWGRGRPKRCTVVNVSGLLRELILEATARQWLDRRVARDRRLMGVIRDQLEALSAAPLDLPMPRDERAARVAEAVRARPGEPGGIEVLARQAGASKRTIERLFRNETGMTFGQWRRQARLLEGLRRLAAGEAVKTASVATGYGSASAFVTMFRRALGTTPKRYGAAS